jgi:hypothetical protein
MRRREFIAGPLLMEGAMKFSASKPRELEVDGLTGRRGPGVEIAFFEDQSQCLYLYCLLL